MIFVDRAWLYQISTYLEVHHTSSRRRLPRLEADVTADAMLWSSSDGEDEMMQACMLAQQARGIPDAGNLQSLDIRRSQVLRQARWYLTVERRWSLGS